MVERPEQPPELSRMTNPPDGIVPSGPTGAAPIELADSSAEGLLGGPASSGPATSPAFSLPMLLSCKWLILGISALVAALTIPCIWLFAIPRYRATAVVRVSPVVSPIVFRTEDNGIVPLYRSYLNTQVSVIRSPTLLQRVLDREEIRNTRWYQETPSPILGFVRTPRSPIERLYESLSVRPRRDTELIDVTITTLDRKDAKLIVDTVVNEYKRLSDETLRESDIRRFATLTTEHANLQREIDGLVATKFNVSKRLGTTRPEELRSQLSSQLNTLEADYEELRLLLAMTEWELEAFVLVEEEGTEANGDEGAEQNESDDVPKQYAVDAEWRTLNIDAETARHQLDLAHQRYGDSHPRIAQLVTGVEHAERLRHEREAQLDEQWRGGASQFATVSNEALTVVDEALIKRDAQRLQRRSQLLGEQIEHQHRKVTEAGEIAEDMAHYDEEIRYKRELYDAVRSRLSQLEMESKAPARISVAAHAIQPTQSYRDRRILLTVVALAGAMFMGLVVGYLRVTTDPRIRQAGDVQRTVRVPFLGQLPPLPGARELMVNSDPALLERVRMVRTALLKRVAGSGQRVILITSSSSRAGKTSVAILLAKSLAQLGKKTLLVEADLHRPSLKRYLDLESDTGLADVLMEAVDDRTAIIPTCVPKFDVLPAGNASNGFDFELLANGVLSACLGRWKKTYDFVLVDSPPLLPVADARILAGQADGAIMVLRSAHCRRDEVIQAYADLSAGGGTLVGTVLAGVRTRRGYGYGYYGGYYRSPDGGSRTLEG